MEQQASRFRAKFRLRRHPHYIKMIRAILFLWGARGRRLVNLHPSLTGTHSMSGCEICNKKKIVWLLGVSMGSLLQLVKPTFRGSCVGRSGLHRIWTAYRMWPTEAYCAARDNAWKYAYKKILGHERE